MTPREDAFPVLGEGRETEANTGREALDSLGAPVSLPDLAPIPTPTQPRPLGGALGKAGSMR